MNKPFAVFDIDGTLIRWQLYHAIADTMIKLGYADAAKYHGVKDARMAWKKRQGKEAFRAYEQQLVRAYESVLTSLTFEQFHTAAQAVFDEHKDQVYRYTRGLISQLKSQGYLLFAISGSQIEIVQMIADYYGFDDCVGSLYERSKSGFTGNVTVHGKGKHVILDQLVKKHGATYKGSYAIGDSETDITMLEAVTNPIAMNPTKKLFETAQAKGWKVVIERKNVIYNLEPGDGSYILATAD